VGSYFDNGVPSGYLKIDSLSWPEVYRSSW